LLTIEALEGSTMAVRVQSAVDRFIRSQGWMDGVAEAVQGAIGKAYETLGPNGRTLKDALHGTAVLGHPLHPAATDLPIGAWLIACIADSTGQDGAADTAHVVTLGALTVSALSGYTDFHETYGHERRVALTHGLSMTVAYGLEATSLLLRAVGARGVARTLSATGLAIVAGAAYLGGDLVYGIGTMVNRNAFLEAPEDFVDVGASGDFPEGALRRVQANGAAVLVVRQDGRLNAIGAVCSHAGGPLDEGTLEGGCVTCPWHGSVFRIDDGTVVHGPATFSQPPFEARERDGRVQVKVAVPLH
jgi:nitrite reductase/ring-hydroxylating ferredoxin subunit